MPAEIIDLGNNLFAKRYVFNAKDTGFSFQVGRFTRTARAIEVNRPYLQAGATIPFSCAFVTGSCFYIIKT